VGRCNEARERLVETLEDASLVVVSDARNIRPGCVIIDPPTITRSTPTQISMEFIVTAVQPPPGNLDALIALLNLVDLVIDATGATSANSTVYSAGGQELPAYQITVPWVGYPA